MNTFLEIQLANIKIVQRYKYLHEERGIRIVLRDSAQEFILVFVQEKKAEQL